ncbi:HlyD family efflux transporter periplasmic adaptor subunit [Methyloligella sp. GL2]|uniref:HlyD family secretion protein n=1 Tax=Methyloligella sp. GL2 TaxID=2742204 RepID=UPI00157E2B63|nr:HlyD family secretion protein [Methyloligella sp. GL2]QKP76976.1 HlyD family efflux transporter periplasmic adaptor subunit [Methyloligella sp. GL2]
MPGQTQPSSAPGADENDPNAAKGTEGQDGAQGESAQGEPAGEAEQHGDIASLLEHLTKEVRAWDDNLWADAPVDEESGGEDRHTPYEDERLEPEPVSERAISLFAPAPDDGKRDAKFCVDGDAAKDAKPQGFTRHITKWRVIKSAVALAALIALGWEPLERLVQVTSAEATVNARLITLRSPIDGKLVLSHGPMQVGSEVTADELLAKVENPRADRSRLNDLRRNLADLKFDVASLATRIEQLESHRDELKVQRDAFQDGRVKQLEAEAEEYSSDIISAEAAHKEASIALQRAKKLRERGYQTEAVLDEAVRDEQMASSKVNSLKHKLTGTKVELEAAKKGLFVGDSYNDIPRTAQRVDEITAELVGLKADLSAKRGRMQMLRSELALEQKHYDDMASADIAVPVGGRVWEVLTANHEVVSHGQPLFKVLDCAGALVTASVSEATYNELKLGQDTSFYLRGGSAALPGRVVALNGLADVSSNLALGQGIFKSEPYHVAVAVPGLADQPDCYFGRTGKVTFDTASPGQVMAATQP